MGVMALAGMARAVPPVDPYVEGREPNPVAREFHQPDTTAGGYVPPYEEPAAGAAWLLPALQAWELLDQLTVPLGTAPMGEPNDWSI